MKCTVGGCSREIYGLTGLQEIDHFRRHLRNRHQIYVSFEKALEMRSDSGQ